MSTYHIVLTAILLVSVLSLAIAIMRIAKGKVGDFEPILYVVGFLLFSAFIWADVLTFSLLWIILVPVLWLLHNSYYLLLTWSGFWFIRSSGEVVYSFLQQFNPDRRPYAAYLSRHLMSRLFGPAVFQKYWVVEQTIFQSLSVLSFVLVVYAITRLR